MNFKDQYRHPKWQEKRLLVIQANKLTCEDCKSKDKELHVHHPYYLTDTKVWEYPTTFLKCLCFECHGKVHKLDTKIKHWLAELSYDSKMVVFLKLKQEVKKFLDNKTIEVIEPVSNRLEIYGEEMSMSEMLEKLMGDKNED